MRFGQVPLIGFTNHMSCMSNISHVPSPPYSFDSFIPLSNQQKLPPPNNIWPNPDPCCDKLAIRDSANQYSELIIQRDLIDPNYRNTILTVRDLALLKRLNAQTHNAYQMINGTLRAVGFDYQIESKMSIVLIGINNDTQQTRQRLVNRFTNASGILPSRMLWESLPSG